MNAVIIGENSLHEEAPLIQGKQNLEDDYSKYVPDLHFLNRDDHDYENVSIATMDKTNFNFMATFGNLKRKKRQNRRCFRKRCSQVRYC